MQKNGEQGNSWRREAMRMETGLSKLGGSWYLWIHKGQTRVVLNTEEIAHLTAQIEAGKEFLAVVK